jgi:membrane protease subunit HflK
MNYRDSRGQQIDVGDLIAVLKRNLPWIGLFLATAVVLFAVNSIFYRIEASDEGVVLRFGKHVETTQPGLHWKFPWPIGKVYKVPVQRIQTLEFGFKTERPGRVTRFAPVSDDQLAVSEMLTGDLNLANVEWIVQYRIKDAHASLFNIGGADDVPAGSLPSGETADVNPAVPDIIRNVAESVMRKLTGDTSVDAILTLGRDQIAGDAKLGIQQMLDEFQAGVEIVTVKLQSTSPPEEVKDAFQEVNRARQNKERVVNEAEGERNRQIPAARGKRDQAILEAEGYQERIILVTTGQINAFLAQLAEYEEAEDITRVRLYLETMEDVLTATGEMTIIDESLQGILPILNLDQAAAASPEKRGPR